MPIVTTVLAKTRIRTAANNQHVRMHWHVAKQPTLPRYSMNPEDLQPFLDVAISVLASKDAIAASKLKYFLAASPGPTYTEQALGLAVVHFAKDNPAVFNWIISNQDILAPELDLKFFTRKMIRQQLVRHGWVVGKDFILELDKLLIVDEASIAKLNSYFSEGEMTLIKVFFHVDLLPFA